MQDREIWKIIPEFPNYEVSNHGGIYNRLLKRLMSTSLTREGNVKISLLSIEDGKRYTRSVAKLVAEAFVEKPKIHEVHPRRHYPDQVVMLDGNLSNVRADNLVWRPRWMAWLYREQLTTPQPERYYKFRIRNLRTGIEYDSVIEAGMSLGLLFSLIYESTYTGKALFPYWDRFEELGRNDG